MDISQSNWTGKNGPILIAEIGGNHEGDFEYAKVLTRLALEANVDYVKFQIYSGDTLVSKEESPKRNKHFKKFELSRENYLELAQMCEESGAKFMASVWDIEALQWIDKHIPIYKIGSGDLTAYEVLRNIALTGKPIILSTGLSSLLEVLDAVKFIQGVNPVYSDPNYLSLMQCTSMYPIPYSDANLRVMNSYRSLTRLPTGYSDHTEGSKALEVAVAMGAQLLEFHFTDTREGKSFRDHKVSLTKNEVLKLIDSIKEILQLRGSQIKEPLAIEGEHVVTFRRAVYPKKSLKVGDILTRDDLISLRPNAGIDARDFEKLLGKKINRDVLKHQKLDWSFFD